MGWAKRSVFKSPWWPLGSSLLQNASLLQPLPQVSPSVCCPAVGLLLLGAGSGVPGRAAPCTTRPGLDPRGPLPGLALWRQGHPTGRRSPICLGPQLGRLETFPGLLPHLGVLVIGAFSNFCTEATGFSRTFPGLCPHLLMLPCWFHLPLFRDYIMCSGLVSSAKASAAYLLSRPGGGQVAVLAVGGPLEALEAKPGALSLRIRNQKGFVKLALEHGASLVPVFSFGENELFQQFPNPPGSWVRRAQEALQRVLSLALPLFHGRLGLLLPFRTPVCTVVGAPIPVPRTPRPSRAQVDALHALYVERLTGLFEEHKGRYGIPADRHLVLT
ncbi:2-acylglycerol O-acyltransferase 3 isoform X3 [Phyllostomus discolor]|uniref:Acyltransferase n=1 Tax=Phyllostomus discolor TaxID=89673 RepID=A0A7E6DBI5_9CHIR|nr:2-acylglycerol O-acyltransferase 3 isoform X3 [Phyllostomus discolor]